MGKFFSRLLDLVVRTFYVYHKKMASSCHISYYEVLHMTAAGSNTIIPIIGFIAKIKRQKPNICLETLRTLVELGT